MKVYREISSEKADSLSNSFQKESSLSKFTIFNPLCESYDFSSIFNPKNEILRREDSVSTDSESGRKPNVDQIYKIKVINFSNQTSLGEKNMQNFIRKKIEREMNNKAIQTTEEVFSNVEVFTNKKPNERFDEIFKGIKSKAFRRFFDKIYKHEKKNANKESIRKLFKILRENFIIDTKKENNCKFLHKTMIDLIEELPIYILKLCSDVNKKLESNLPKESLEKLQHRYQYLKNILTFIRSESMYKLFDNQNSKELLRKTYLEVIKDFKYSGDEFDQYRTKLTQNHSEVYIYQFDRILANFEAYINNKKIKKDFLK